MASYSVSNSNGRFTLTLYVGEDATSIENNTSTLSYSLELTANTSYDFDGYHIGYLITLDGSDVAYSSRANSPQYSCGAYSSVTIASGSGVVVSHNSDGSKTISILFSIDMEADDWTPGSLSDSDSMVLTTIPRASVLNAISNFNVDSGLTVRITKYYSGFCDDIYIDYAGTRVGSYHDASDGTVVHFTADQLSTIYGLMSAVQHGTFTISLNTYNSGGGALVGSSTPQTATGYINNANPTLTASVVDVNSATVALTGNSAKLVKYKSTARVTLSASGNKGASITSKVVNGTAVSGTTLDIVGISATPLTVTATDSRGNSSTVTLNPVVVPYVPLTCSASFYRPEPTTGEVAVKFSGNYFNGSFGTSGNSLLLSWAYRLKGATSWTAGGSQLAAYTLSGNTYSLAATSLGTGFDYTQSYEFILYYADKLVSTNTGVITVTRGLPIMEWGKDDVKINGALAVSGMISGTMTNKFAQRWADWGSADGYTFSFYGMCQVLNFGGKIWRIRIKGVIAANDHAGDGTVDIKYGIDYYRVLDTFGIPRTASCLCGNGQHTNALGIMYTSGGTIDTSMNGYGASMELIISGTTPRLLPGRFFQLNGAEGGWQSSAACAQVWAQWDFNFVVIEP